MRRLRKVYRQRHKQSGAECFLTHGTLLIGVYFDAHLTVYLSTYLAASIVQPISMFWFQKDEKLIGKKGPDIVSNWSDDKIFTFDAAFLSLALKSQHDRRITLPARRTSGR